MQSLEKNSINETPFIKITWQHNTVASVSAPMSNNTYTSLPGKKKKKKKSHPINPYPTSHSNTQATVFQNNLVVGMSFGDRGSSRQSLV